MNVPTQIFMAVEFPPPLNGANKNSAKIASILERANLVLHSSRLSLGQAIHSGGVVFHCRRIYRYCILYLRLIRFCLMQSNTIAYHVPNGALGLMYSIPIGFICRSLRVPLVLHHRTFQYIDEHMKLMDLLLLASGRQVLHVFLSERMSDCFFKQYSLSLPHIVLSNAALNDLPVRRSEENWPKTGELRVGHLSTLSREKGFFDVAQVFETLHHDLEGRARIRIAGAVESKEVQEELDRLIAAYGEKVEYLGIVEGDSKRLFFRGLDFFLFPTHYKKEAQPNVLFESLASGVPVLTYARGCIPEMLPDDGSESLLLSSEEDFSSLAAKWILQKLEADLPENWKSRSIHCCDFVQQQTRIAEEQLKIFVRRISDRAMVCS